MLEDEAKAIENLERTLNRLGDKKDKAYGVKKLNLIKKEIEATKELIATNQQALVQANTDAQGAKDELLAEVGANAQFDKNGNLLNREELLQSYVNKGQAEYDNL